MFLSILNALAAIPSLTSFIETTASTIVAWWINRQTQATLGLIANAAAESAAAQTSAQRYTDAAAWQKALSGTRDIS